MSKEAFAKKFATDKAFAEKVWGLKSAEETKALAQAEGFNLTDEEASSILSKLQQMNQDGMTLDDMTLDLAAGGSGIDCGKIQMPICHDMTSPPIESCFRKFT